ncbi:hypothetical protein ACH5RR_039376 [Cinchona calisaya]|uniref:Uncharacterized protein n=1 Tax=Cinchona calisaya TaxID=153742 RepID=A0ABD2Y3N9_9GENT
MSFSGLHVTRERVFVGIKLFSSSFTRVMVEYGESRNTSIVPPTFVRQHITPDADVFSNSGTVVRILNGIIKSHWHEKFINWTIASQNVCDLWWNEFSAATLGMM